MPSTRQEIRAALSAKDENLSWDAIRNELDMQDMLFPPWEDDIAQELDDEMEDELMRDIRAEIEASRWCGWGIEEDKMVSVYQMAINNMARKIKDQGVVEAEPVEYSAFQAAKYLGAAF